MTTTVINIKDRKGQKNTIYIGRPSIFGNPFAMRTEMDRSRVIAQFDEYFHRSPALMARARRELVNKILVCFCAPKPCHGDIIAEYLNQE